MPSPSEDETYVVVLRGWSFVRRAAPSEGLRTPTGGVAAEATGAAARTDAGKPASATVHFVVARRIQAADERGAARAALALVEAADEFQSGELSRGPLSELSVQGAWRLDDPYQARAVDEGLRYQANADEHDAAARALERSLVQRPLARLTVWLRTRLGIWAGA